MWQLYLWIELVPIAVLAFLIFTLLYFEDVAKGIRSWRETYLEWKAKRSSNKEKS